MAVYPRVNPNEDLTDTPEAAKFYELVILAKDIKDGADYLTPTRHFEGREVDESFRGFRWGNDDYLQAAFRIYAGYAKAVLKYAAQNDTLLPVAADRVPERMELFLEKLKDYPEVYKEIEPRFGRLFFTEEEWNRKRSMMCSGIQRGFNPCELSSHKLFRSIMSLTWLYDEYCRRFFPGED